jgi:EmrB/QacA subfamily drug resistance transporter
MDVATPAIEGGGPGSRARWVAALVAGAFFMENLDGTVITTAIPAMARTFGARPADLSAGISAYLLTLAVFIPISGWVADRFGPRNVFATAVSIFTLASVACGFSGSLGEFTFARVVQGMGGAMMVPVGRLVVLRNADKRGLVRAIATLVWPGLVAPILGPPVGGLITTWWNWRWIFFLNVPLGLVALALALVLIRGAPGERRPFDLRGFVLAGVGCSALMYALELLGRDSGWKTATAFAVGALAMAWAIVHLRRTPHPLVDLGTLRVHTFAVTLRGGSCSAAAVHSAPFLLPLLFQVGLGMSAVTSGSLLLFLFAGNLSMKPATTWVLRRFGFRRVLLVNGLVVVSGFVVCSLIGPSTPHAVIAAVLFACGLCRSMQFTAFNTLAFADVSGAQMSGATTLFSAFGQMTAGIGVALGALSLHVVQALRGHAGEKLAVADFRIAFLAVALLPVLSLCDAWQLPRDAGAEVSGHRGARSPSAA